MFALTPTQARNRRLLLDALRSGLSVDHHSVNTYFVTSASRPGLLHQVRLEPAPAGGVQERCSCQWGEQQGWIAPNSGKLACKHILLVRWQRLGSRRRQGMLSLDPALAHALLSRSAVGGALPLDRECAATADLWEQTVPAVATPTVLWEQFVNSGDGKTYRVQAFSDVVVRCNCPDFQQHGRCTHLAQAKHRRINWDGAVEPAAERTAA